jgi:hypothetical protein
MPQRKLGGQPGNKNAIKHGRHSVPLRAARLAAVRTVFKEQRRRADEWIASRPTTDYDAICDELRRLKRESELG